MISKEEYEFLKFINAGADELNVKLEEIQPLKVKNREIIDKLLSENLIQDQVWGRLEVKFWYALTYDGKRAIEEYEKSENANKISKRANLLSILSFVVSVAALIASVLIGVLVK